MAVQWRTAASPDHGIRCKAFIRESIRTKQRLALQANEIEQRAGEIYLFKADVNLCAEPDLARSVQADEATRRLQQFTGDIQHLMDRIVVAGPKAASASMAARRSSSFLLRCLSIRSQLADGVSAFAGGFRLIHCAIGAGQQHFRRHLSVRRDRRANAGGQADLC